MNIESTSIKFDSKTSNTKSSQTNLSEDSIKFADELKELKESEQVVSDDVAENKQEAVSDKKDKEVNQVTANANDSKLNDAMEGLNFIVKKLNQSEDKLIGSIKNDTSSADNNNVINNDFNIQENKDLLPQMNPNMNFGGDGQPFSSFMNNEQQNNNANGVLAMNSKDLAEEAAILSTMAENIALANKNNLLKDSTKIEEKVNIFDSKEKNIVNNEIQKANILIENTVKYDSIIMNQADVEVFAELVNKGEVNLNNLTEQAVQKTVQVSKTLANMLAKSMENNQPLRIDFDNDISVIIRISRDGKISADFLPSSQVAEAYLKENLPLLRQKFEDNNIKYDELNQRERRENKEHNRKKGRNDE